MNILNKLTNFFSFARFNFINLSFNLEPTDFICYRVYKYNPQYDKHPSVNTYFIQVSEQFPMLLDNLFYLQHEKDSGLSFRRSCREGICGSCGMNVNGLNTLACTYKVTDHISFSKSYLNIYPLPHMTVIKDLVVCLKHFYEQYKEIDPFLIKYYLYDSIVGIENPNIEMLISRPSKENYQTKKHRQYLDGLYECILCACCSTSCPSYWWNKDLYLGPAVLLQAYRWFVDSRDEKGFDRLDDIDNIYSLHRCHTILNCVRCCPKHLNPAQAIQDIKEIQYFRKHPSNTL